jgi:hypothetical protein
MKENTRTRLKARAKRIEQGRRKAIKLKRWLKSELQEVCLEIGIELIGARRDIEAGETNFSCEEWYKQDVKLPDRTIQWCIELANAAGSARARERARARPQAANAAAKDPAHAREK